MQKNLYIEKFKTMHYSEAISFINTNNLTKVFDIKENLVKIFKTPRALCEIARICFKCRVKEFEQTISRDLWMSLLYATQVVKGQLPEAMHNIMLAEYIKDSNNEKTQELNYLKKLLKTRC